MRILFDSKQPQYKSPFGTLMPGQKCTLRIDIPVSVQTVLVECLIHRENGEQALCVPLHRQGTRDAVYDLFGGDFSLCERGLYFYYFRIHTPDSSFRLFRQGNDTNMEAGDCWQLSCIPADFSVPEWAMGAVFYQIFPDRFCQSGNCDLTGKLTPYTIHAHWDEEIAWQPTPDGAILNNDFYGGNFRGIMEKLDYISSLGATILYLNPIGKSFSNHRYDTGDYKTPDPMLGTISDFSALCDAAHSRGIRIVLDGVYSHTGANSLYFDRAGNWGGNGAACRQDSPYHSWYTFQQWPNRYTCWWNFDTLPTVNKMDPSFIDYIITGEDSVVAHWLRAGADGFRLDVVDELPDAFVSLLKKRIRELRPDALLIGEVWEDASNKVAYDVRRRYFVDGELDSAMNYPFRTAILNFLRERDDGRALEQTVMTIAENYPPNVLLCNMNLLGTHDTPRILTALVDDFDGSREEKARRHLSPSQYVIAKERLLMASFLQYTLPGAPSLYYGDEAGMEGYQDPFNRRTYPWGREDRSLLEHFRQLGQLRQNSEPLRRGDIRFFQAGDQRIGFSRRCISGTNSAVVRIYANRSCDDWDLRIDGQILLAHNLRTVAPDRLTISPMGFCAALTLED